MIVSFVYLLFTYIEKFVYLFSISPIAAEINFYLFLDRFFIYLGGAVLRNYGKLQ